LLVSSPAVFLGTARKELQMLNEISARGTHTHQPTSEEEARLMLERTLPALFAQTTFEVKRFFDAIKKANPYISPNAASVKVPAGPAAAFYKAVGAIDSVRVEENVNHGGVFIPFEGEPWNGFRLASAQPSDLNRDLVSDHHIWEQMLSASLTLVRNMKQRDDGTYEATKRDIQSLISIYACPAAETWTPPSGFRYREVRNAMVEASGGPSNEISTHVMQAITLIPESRIIPRISEVMNGADLRPISRRVASNLALKEAQASFDIQVEAPAPKSAGQTHRSGPTAQARLPELALQTSFEL